MKTFSCALAGAVVGAFLGAGCVTAAFADASPAGCNANTPKTRAEVMTDLTQWRAAGYDPLDWLNYPQNALDASRIVWQQRVAAGQTGDCGR
ncbi:DUF4148 domain-containing protein [Paraburkholderia sp. DHOC27]|uniref:DUF4148 domain-containing protein n=1 Tax=Paraburkholderia sp. DHOC27 TaxID=2303330 RepID=UPI000E3DC11A|nr:DUF4148 domain-containing protein [Paraburkholderia sp. DHOC27]RFU44691.1 DUF4148 domain-containing protein [Paraburkholderia sp. DHOC27]